MPRHPATAAAAGKYEALGLSIAPNGAVRFESQTGLQRIKVDSARA